MMATRAAAITSMPPTVSARRISATRERSGSEPGSNSREGRTGVLTRAPRGSTSGPPTRLPGTPSSRLQARRPGRLGPSASGALDGDPEAEERGVVVRPTGDREPDRHARVRHRAHRDGDGGDAEVTDRQVAVGDPDAVAPAEVGRCGVDVH